MKHVFRLFSGFCLLFLYGALALAGDSSPVMAIVHTNDVHGRYAVSDEAIGHDRIATIFKETRKRIPATVLLDAGDAIQGTGLVKWNKGQAAIDIMNAAGYDALALGNHEFDYGWANLASLVRLAEFPVLTQPIVSEGTPGFEAAALFERGGHRIGVFGLTTPETKRSSTGGLEREFGSTEEVLAYADAMAAALRAAGAEAVVCLAHVGVDDQGFITSYELRDRTSGIDVIVDGHSHTPLAEINQAEGKALIVSAGEHAQAVGLVEFSCKNGRLVPVARSLLKQETLAIAPDPAVAKIIAQWVEEEKARGSRILVRSPYFLEASRHALRTSETELGDLMADAIREATGSDAALINGGNIRADLPAGEVTVDEIEAILPFDTTIHTADLAGGVIKEALEMSVSRYPGESGGFLQVSGLAFTFNPDAPAGRRVIDVSLGGRPLEDDRVYKVAACSWLADGGDNYEMLVGPFRRQSDSEVLPLIDVFVRYLEKRADIPPPTLENRILHAEGAQALRNQE